MKSPKSVWILLILFVGVIFLVNAQLATPTPTLSQAWVQGYWLGTSNGLAAAQQQVQIAKKGSPPDLEMLRRTLLAGLTNNPYRN